MARRVLWGSLSLAPLTILLHYFADLGDTVLAEQGNIDPVHHAEATLVAATDSTPLAEVVAGVTEHLAAHWSLPPAEAGATAEEAVAFWDESGFFVIQGSARRVAPRIRLFAEAMAGRGASRH